MISKILEYIRKNRILEDGDSVILGVSGGADSICLLYVLEELKDKLNLNITVVHVNHHIRGDEAKADAEFVRELCRKLCINFKLVNVNVRALVQCSGKSEEEAARDARYEVFHRVAKEIGADKIAVAHNLNDNSETVLFHLFRGTGIKGLSGIPEKRGKIVRPLLCCTRKEIEAYLMGKGVEYRTDSTNYDTKYSRNKIRLELLPYIKENINNKVEYNIVNAAKNLNIIADYMKGQIDKAFAEFVEENLLKEEGFSSHPALLHGVIRQMLERQMGNLKDITQTHIEAVAALKDMQVSKQICLPNKFIAERTYHGIKIKKNETMPNKKVSEQVLMRNGRILPSVNIQISILGVDFNKNNIKDLLYTKWFDYDKINKLVLRTRKPGDYIVINDKGSRKKIKDYFIDEKIPQKDRDKILLLADDSHIVWIIGYRMSDQYKVTKKTQKVVRIDYRA